MGLSGAANETSKSGSKMGRAPVWLLEGAAVALLLSGCSGGGQQSSCATRPDPELRATEAQIPANNYPSTAAVQPSPARTVYGPRSQADIDKAYEIPPPIVLAPVAPRSAPAYSGDDLITADPRWDVQITREWRHIVVHHSASNVGSAAIFDRAHRERGWDGLGYHFVIGNGSASGDGQVEVGYRWSKQIQGAHAGNAEYNQHGIGICLVGDFENGGTPSPAQMASLRKLVRFLQVKTGIPTSEVIGHGNVPGKSTQCPGRNLDVANFRAALGGNAIPVPIHYTAAAGTPSTPARVARRAPGSEANAMSMP